MKLGVGLVADWVKIALKTGLVAGVMAALWAVFTQIQIPTYTYSYVFNGWNNAISLIKYWYPQFPIIWNFSLSLIGILLALWTFRFATVAIRWLFKVNE